MEPGAKTRSIIWSKDLLDSPRTHSFKPGRRKSTLLSMTLTPMETVKPHQRSSWRLSKSMDSQTLMVFSSKKEKTLKLSNLLMDMSNDPNQQKSMAQMWKMFDIDGNNKWNESEAWDAISSTTGSNTPPGYKA